MEVKEAPKRTLSERAQKDYDNVLRAIDGCQNSYKVLMDRYRHSVFHMMLKMVNNRDDAEDLMLEAFGKAFNKLPSYAPNYAFSTWLFKIAINNCIDHIRKKRLKMLSIDDPLEPNGSHDYSNNLRSSSLDPEEIIIREQRLDARELEIPLGTVKAQLFRAKEIMYNHLQNPGAKAYLENTLRKKDRIRLKEEAMAAAINMN